MELNIGNIPKAIMYFILGIFINLVLYWVFSPDKANLIGILGGIFTSDSALTGVIWIGIMSVSILANLLYPLWVVVDTDD